MITNYSLKRIKEKDIPTATIDGITYNFLIDDDKREVYLVDDELKQIDTLNIEAHCSQMNSTNDPMVIATLHKGQVCLELSTLRDHFNNLESKFIKVDLFVDKWYTAIINNTGRIIVPFGLDRGMECHLDESNSRILFTSYIPEKHERSKGYGHLSIDYNTGVTRDCIFSIEGEKLFPNDKNEYKNISIVEISKLGICIGIQRIPMHGWVQYGFCIIQNDYTLTPFEEKVDNDFPSIDNSTITCEILRNGLIIATQHIEDSILAQHCVLLDSRGHFITSADRIEYDEINDLLVAPADNRTL